MKNILNLILEQIEYFRIIWKYVEECRMIFIFQKLKKKEGLNIKIFFGFLFLKALFLEHFFFKKKLKKIQKQTQKHYK